LVRAECIQREEHRVARLQRFSGLPPDTTFRTLQLERFPAVIREQLERLRSGAFLEDAINVVAAGEPGVGKSHALARLDRYACVFLDDIGYVQHDRDEMEVLFTFLAERYEHRSVAISTNLVFSDWNRIFKDPMTTLAAIDRVVHHSVILDLMGMDSYRAREATQERTPPPPPPDPADPPVGAAGGRAA
jgi:DNA replication protein DnaC